MVLIYGLLGPYLPYTVDTGCVGEQTYLTGWTTTFAVFNSKGGRQGYNNLSLWWKPDKKGTKTRWLRIEIKYVPTGTASVPTLINDNGRKYNGTMIAGHFVFDGEGSTIQPRADWCLAVKNPQTLNFSYLYS